MPVLDNFEKEHSSNQLHQLNDALESGMFMQVRAMLNQLPAADVAHMLESTPPRARKVLWRLVDTENEGAVLQFLNEDLLNSFAEEMAPQELAAVVAGLDTDDLADIIGDLPDQITDEVLSSMNIQDRTRIEQALKYPEDTAGGLMNTDTIAVRPAVTIEVVLRYLRMQKEIPKSTDSIYVVDTDDVLIGTVQLSTLITSHPDQMVEEVVDEEIEAIPADLPDTDVASLFERHDLVSAPVVDKDGKLLGRITVDDVLDVIIEDADHSLMSMAGMDENDDTFAPVFTSAKRRALWLGINLLTVIAAASFIGIFEKNIRTVATLAVLLPIVASMGGVAGTQSLTLVIRGMSIGHISSNNFRWLVFKELGVSLLNGMMWALINGFSA
ncbi:MAG: magnesium transporter, partial [Kangiellaceae bacterium]|nr:magnesium transporter [Kangiellaceae bacterium]